MKKNQEGSILVGILGLSLVMSLAAGSFVILSTNTAKDGLASAADLQLQYAAESGIQMGLRWTRNYPPASINNPAWATNTDLTFGPDGFANINNREVKVTLIYEGTGVHSIRSIARKGPGQPTVQITQLIQISNPALPAELPLLSTPVLATRTQISTF